VNALSVEQLYEQYIKRLSPAEMRQLVTIIQAYLVQPGTPRRRWAEIAGAGTYPLVGEDAQDWVSRTRLEGDEQRRQ